MRTPDGAAVYHVTCFTCVTCHGRLVPGDRYAMVDGSLVCETDYINAALNSHRRVQQTTSRARQPHGKVHSTLTN